MLRFILSQLWNHSKIIKYASPGLVQLFNFPGLFINHFCSISKTTFSAKFELPDASQIFLKPATVFSFAIWPVFRNLFSTWKRRLRDRIHHVVVICSPTVTGSDFQQMLFPQISFPSAKSLHRRPAPTCPKLKGRKWLNGKALGTHDLVQESTSEHFVD